MRKLQLVRGIFPNKRRIFIGIFQFRKKTQIIASRHERVLVRMYMRTRDPPAEKNKPTKLQEYELKKIENAGGLAFVINDSISPKELKKLLLQEAIEDTVDKLGETTAKKIECPHCKETHTIEHLSWTALVCVKCGATVEKENWVFKDKAYWTNWALQHTS